MTYQITPKPKTVLELFEGHPERWRKGVNSENKLCLLDAIIYVYTFASGAHRKVSVLINRQYITVWNDAPERTFDEVMDICRKAGI